MKKNISQDEQQEIIKFMHERAIMNTRDMIERFSDIPDVGAIWFKVLSELEAKILF